MNVEKHCPNKSCTYVYVSRKKPNKCPMCSEFIGKESIHNKTQEQAGAELCQAQDSQPIKVATLSKLKTL